MKHLSEEEMIELYYGEGTQADAAVHVESCAVCAKAYARLKQDLAGISLDEAPERDSNYGERVWGTLRPSLAPLGAPPRRRIGFNWRWGWGIAAAAAVLIVVAFWAGREWEQIRAPQITARKQSQGSQEKERVILVVLGDHLDRSERLLVELNHPEDASDDPGLRGAARALLAENVTMRERAQDAGQAGRSLMAGGGGDPALQMALDDLDRVLKKVADHPGDLTGDEIGRLQREMNTSGILFEVRVLRSRLEGEVRKPAVAKMGGTA